MKASVTLLVGAVFAIGAVEGRGEQEWEPLFDGKTLEGWSTPEPGYWSVEDGALTAQSTEAMPCKKNQFLVWQGGELGDFELKLKFRLEGTEQANSGIQVRSRVEKDGHAVGYQADLAQPSSQFLGSLYDEKGRGMLALRGQRTTISKDGKKETVTVETPEAAIAGVEAGAWNEYHIVAKGEEITLRINGKLMSVVVDGQEGERDAAGALALQLHSGPPMKVQFKEIRVRRL